MKKLFTPLMALLAILLTTNLSASTQLTTMVNSNFSDWSTAPANNTGGNGTTEYSITGATILFKGAYYNSSSNLPNSGVTVALPNVFRFGSNMSPQFPVTTLPVALSNQYLKISPSTAFVAGGKITFQVSANSNNVAFQVADLESGVLLAEPVITTGNTITEIELNLPVTYNGTKSIIIGRKSTTFFLHAIKIETNSAQPTITAFSVAGIDASIDEAAKTIVAELPYGTNLSALTPTVTIGGTASSYSPAGAQNFSSSAVVYTASNSTQNVNYSVTLTASNIASNDNSISNLTVGGLTPKYNADTKTYSIILPKASNLSSQVIEFSKNVTATSSIVSGNASDITNTLNFTVTAQNNDVATYHIQASVGLKNIAYVTNSANDDPYLLGSLMDKNYYVDEIIANAQTADYFDNFDLVILFDAVTSSNTLALNMGALIGTKRFLNMKAFMYSKQGWPTGTAVNLAAEKVANISNQFVGHPIFSGLSINDTEATLVEDAVSGNGLQGVTSPESGTIIATLKGNSNAACIIENSSVQSAMYLLIGFANGPTNSLINMNANGKKLLDNAVAYLLADTKFVPQYTNQSNKLSNTISFDGRNILNPALKNIQIIDITGRIIISSTQNIDMNQFANAIYFVKTENSCFKLLLNK